MKNTLKNIFDKFGFYFVRKSDYISFLLDTGLENPVLNAMFRKTGKLDRVSFIQIGASDGKISDPIFQNVLKYNWEGVLVEPIQSSFAKLVGRYSGRAGIKFENVAISTYRGPLHLYKYGGNSENLSIDWAHQIASFDKQHLLKYKEFIPDIEDNICTEEVATMTLMSLFKKYSILELDLLQIDAEGYDYEIFKMIDFQKIKPTVINLEFEHLAHDDLMELISKLISENYEFVLGERDLTASLRKV